MRKGFTLVELIAVIAILGLVLAVSIPGVIGVIENNENESYTLIAKAGVSAARIYTSTEDTNLPTTTDTALIITFEDMGLDYGSITNDIDIDSSMSYILIDDEGNYYATVISSDNKKGIINVISTELNESNDQYILTDPDGELANIDPKSLTSFSVHTNGDGLYADVTLNIFVYVSNDAPISFGANNPSDDDTISTTDEEFEIYYKNENVKEIILTINGVDYYILSASAGTTSGTALATCKEIKNSNSKAENGQYYIKPESTTIQTYCDMSSNGGMMLLDNFKGSKGSNQDLYGAAIGGSNITSSATLTAAGWTTYLTNIDNASFTVKDDYLQIYYTSTPTGYIYKTLPSYANMVKVDWGCWYSGTADLLINNSSVQSAASATYPGPLSYEGSYNSGETIKFTETGIFWVGEIWVYEAEDNLLTTKANSEYYKTNYNFKKLTTGANTYQAKVIYNDDSYEVTEERTLTVE